MAVLEICVVKEDKKSFTLDSVEPYGVDSVHKGISRALQGYEVVLLSVLVRAIVLRGGIPINLAHDGCMAIFPGIQDTCFQAGAGCKTGA